MHLSRYPGMLAQGQSIEFRPSGNSMRPHIKSGQLVRLEPAPHDLNVGDIVLARVMGNLYLHQISALRGATGVQISNASGHVNGWTTKDRVYGIITVIYD